ncbi:hypothetical protein PIB30_026479 [Stylosanthes scabra]|uniref:Uncharacterized protein n=1 Tax=Stylosanthes scabra TaxID=79078 RepID=A0ABU6XB96_9FABA|nr:hypothetical protein [Stylosanthes scabra]
MDAAIKSLTDKLQALEKELQDYSLYCKTIRANIATFKKSIHLRDKVPALEKELQDYSLHCKTIRANIATFKKSIQSLRKSNSELLRHEESVAEINRSNSGKRKREVASTSVMKNNQPKKAQLKASEESNPINQRKLIKRGSGDSPTTQRLVRDSRTSPNNCLSKEEMAAAITRIGSWTKENKDELGFYPILKDQITKVILFTNANQEDIELFFKCGLISSLIVFSDFKGKLNGLPKRLSEAAMLFLSIVNNNGEEDEGIILNFTSSQPVFGVNGELLVPSIHYIHMKKFHNRMFFPIKDHNNTCQFDGCFDPFQICGAIARVFQRSQGIQATSRIKVNAFQIGTEEESFLLISNKNEQINEKEYEAVSKFKIPFYALDGEFLSKAPHDLKRGICQLIQQNDDHNCIDCNKSKQLLTEEDNQREKIAESSRSRSMRLCNNKALTRMFTRNSNNK